MDEEQSTGPEGDKVRVARELAREYEGNPADADENYRNQELTVRGEILGIRNVISAVVLRIHGTGERYNGVHFEIHLRNREDAETIEVGDSVEFRGACQGYRRASGPSNKGITWIRFTDAIRK